MLALSHAVVLAKCLSASSSHKVHTQPPRLRLRWLAALTPAQPHIIYVRDGEVVVYRRTRSLLYQCRYKLADRTWVRQTTGKASVEHAIAHACDIYDEARYRQRLGLAHQAHSFAQIANIVLAELRQQVDAVSGKTSYHDYISCIEKYFLPYFAERKLEELTHTDTETATREHASRCT